VALGADTTVLAALDEPVVDPSGLVQSRADATGGHLAVARGHGGTALVEAVAELLDLDVATLGLAALSAEPAVDDLVVVPGVTTRSGAIVAGLGKGTSRDGLARATFEGVAADALAALEAITEAGARWYDHEPIHLAGPVAGLDAHAQILATLSGRTVIANPGVLAAAGACVQAAAVLERAHPAQVADRWDLADGWEVEPEDDPERDHRLAVHAEERDRQRRAWQD
jgi:sugar (pentulose or hexulose) kinase